MGTRTSPCTSSHMQLVVSYKQPTNNKTRIAREQNNIIFTVQLVVSKVLQQISDKITMSNGILSWKWTDHLQPYKVYSHVQTRRVIYRLCTMIMIHRSNFQNKIRNRKYNNFNSQLIKANYYIYPQIVHRAIQCLDHVCAADCFLSYWILWMNFSFQKYVKSFCWYF